MAPQIAILVPRTHVKKVKSALEEYSLLDRRSKITTELSDAGTWHPQQSRMQIPTIIASEKEKPASEDLNEEKRNVLARIGLEDLYEEVEVSYLQNDIPDVQGPELHNPLLKAVREALIAPEALILLDGLGLSATDLVESFPTTYSVYKPMLLLPPNAFSSLAWSTLLFTYPAESQELLPLWSKLASSVGTTHVAINAGIPISSSTSAETENILRSPLNITPIHGDFGLRPNPQSLSNPTPSDFTSAFWVSTCQNGIHQVWAPMYTMFSRGNIREKTRILNLPSVLSCSSTPNPNNETDPSPSSNSPKKNHTPHTTALDLYTGIGYFAFSYKRAGISKILCWELNPWSIEGLRRGAHLNNWTVQIFSDPIPTPQHSPAWQTWHDQLLSLIRPETDFIVFRDSNENAHAALSVLIDSLPPVRHVNCGFLPSSKGAWREGVRGLDKKAGGWIHAHENVGFEELERRRGEVVAEMQGFVDEGIGEEREGRRRVVWEHTEKVKTYAPGVWHVVFDVWVEGEGDRKVV
ncbi:S-adenosyl-L-methionine-dependent methyltransferase [Dendryphion nanum]|uniref:tRNA(Phe) (4-demethylwyosine(37)-C(7)) aminocarboxypropyltransferase n=1 Tax=Dendryphion nanum TaxID=256645 RepID=A0A9P9IDJ7_9PLEO|nr:S-adenosyl-L-methionine-dependent methyltransferase [Dendryphion nanum]